MTCPVVVSPRSLVNETRPFELARYLQGVAPGVFVDEFYAFVTGWFDEFKENIGTKDFDETWNEFVYGYPRVENPTGKRLPPLERAKQSYPAAFWTTAWGKKPTMS